MDKGFSLEAIADADDFYWDRTTNRPASKIAKALKKCLTKSKKATLGWASNSWTVATTKMMTRN